MILKSKTRYYISEALLWITFVVLGILSIKLENVYIGVAFYAYLCICIAIHYDHKIASFEEVKKKYSNNHTKVKDKHKKNRKKGE